METVADGGFILQVDQLEVAEVGHQSVDGVHRLLCSQIETRDHLSKAEKRCGKMIIGLVAQSVTAVQVSDVRVSSTISHGGPYDGQQSVAMNVAVASASPNKSAPTSSRYAVQLRTRFANASR